MFGLITLGGKWVEEFMESYNNLGKGSDRKSKLNWLKLGDVVPSVFFSFLAAKKGSLGLWIFRLLFIHFEMLNLKFWAFSHPYFNWSLFLADTKGFDIYFECYY